MTSHAQNRAIKEIRSIPTLIYAVEQYERYLIQLTKRSKVRHYLIQLTKKSKVRHYLIECGM